MNTPVPLCIDLDGALLNSDLLLESALAQLKQAPLSILYWPHWLNLKAKIAGCVELDIDTLPDQIAQGIAAAVDRGRDQVYLPWFWRWIMMIIHIPERVFKRLKL